MKRISDDNLKKIINESLEEVMTEGPTPLGSGPKPLGNGPKPLGGGPKPLGGNLKPQAPAGGNDKVEGGKMKDGSFLPSVEDVYYEKWWEENNPNAGNATNEDEVLKAKVGFIFPVHREYLQKKWENDYADTFATFWDTRSGVMKFVVNPGKEKDFISDIPAIFNDIASLNGVYPKFGAKQGWKLNPVKGQFNYSVNLFPKIEQQFKDYIAKAPSKADLQQREANIAATWKELLMNMQNPTTLQKLQNIAGAVYSTTSASLSSDVKGKGGFDAGHQISYQNKIEVFSQDPNATFVTQEFVWRDLYNRQIIDPNRKILITKPTSRKPRDQKAFERACIECGYSGAEEFAKRKKAGNISTQELWAVQSKYNMLNPGDTQFGRVVVYDVANTELMKDANGNPMEDVFNNEMGLIDNIKGIPNDKAISADKQLAQQTGQQFVQGQMAGPTDEELEKINSIITAIVSQKTGTVASTTGNIGDDIVDNAYHYAKYLAGSINFSKPEYKEAYCQAFSSAVAATYGFPTPKGAQYLRQVLSNRGVDSELSTMINLFFSEYRSFVVEVNTQLMKERKKMKKVSAPVSNVQPVVEEEVSEGFDGGFTPIQPLSAEQLSTVLGIPVELFNGQQKMEESFFNMLERMDKVE